MWKALDGAHICGSSSVEEFDRKLKRDKRYKLKTLKDEYGIGNGMFRLTPKEIKDGTEKRCSGENPKMVDLFGPLFGSDCDLKTVVDVEPMRCPKGQGVVLDVENENLVEKCQKRGPFVERYRIETTISFQSGDGTWCSSARVGLWRSLEAVFSRMLESVLLNVGECSLECWSVFS